MGPSSSKHKPPKGGVVATLVNGEVEIGRTRSKSSKASYYDGSRTPEGKVGVGAGVGVGVGGRGRGRGKDRPLSMRITESVKSMFRRQDSGVNQSFRFRPKMPEFVNINQPGPVHPNARNAWGEHRTVSTIDIIKTSAGNPRRLEDALRQESLTEEPLHRARKASKRYPAKPPEGGMPNASNLVAPQPSRGTLFGGSAKTKSGRMLRPYDVDNYYFSAVNMDEGQLKEACLTMLLTTVNERVFLPEAFSTHYVENKKASRASMKVMKGKNLRSSSESRDIELRAALTDFIEAVASKYTKTSYHSFKHAVDVTQMMYILITYYLDERLTTTEPFFLLVSCMCHDIGHMGANNAFLRSDPNSDFIKEFGSESCLERFHVKTALHILDTQRLFSREFMSEQTNEELKSLLEYVIIATDMEKHQYWMDEFFKDTQKPENIKLMKTGKKKSSGFMTLFRRSRADNGAPINRLPRTYLAMTIKLADIANVTRDFPDAKEWAKKLSFEFEAMGDLGSTNTADLIEQQGMCNDPDLNDLGKFTLSFMGAFAVPMAQAYAAVSTRGSWFLLREMYTNMQMWLTISKDAAAMLEDCDDNLNEGG